MLSFLMSSYELIKFKLWKEIQMKQHTAFFTGHRALPEGIQKELEERVERAVLQLAKRGVRFFGAGGARGFDMLAEETVLRLKRTNPQIRLILVLPFRGQERYWREEEQRRYERIRRSADKVVTLYDR